MHARSIATHCSEPRRLLAHLLGDCSMQRSAPQQQPCRLLEHLFGDCDNVKADVYDNLCDSAAAWRISVSLVGIAVTTFGLACVSYGLQVTHRPASPARAHTRAFRQP